MLSQVLVMHFVRSTNRFQINRIRITEHFESLVNENVMHQKIGETINRNAQSDPEKIIETVH